MSPAFYFVSVLKLMRSYPSAIMMVCLCVEERTDSSRFDHVPYREPLDCLVFGRASRAVGASDRLDAATTFLVTSAVKTLGFTNLVPPVPWISYLDALFLTISASSLSDQQVFPAC